MISPRGKKNYSKATNHSLFHLSRFAFNAEVKDHVSPNGSGLGLGN